MSSEFTLDEAQFERVSRARGAVFYLDLFFEQAEQISQILQNGVDQDQPNDWVGAAHKLKGAAATLGFISTAQLLEQTQHVNLSDTTAKQDAIVALEAELARIRMHFATG